MVPRLQLVRPGRRLRSRMGVRTRAVGRALVTPIAQLVYAAGLALFGAWLIAVWVMGLLIIVFALIIATDALLRENKPKDQTMSRHEEILDRWRKAR